MHNIACNIKFQYESLYLQHWQANKNSEVVKNSLKKTEYKRRGKKQLVEKANAVPVLQMKKKPKNQPTTRQDSWVKNPWSECIRTFHP